MGADGEWTTRGRGGGGMIWEETEMDQKEFGDGAERSLDWKKSM